ncbi:MAG: hypothetical protein WBS54_00285 [Acidobacteriota bacterium]
MSIGERGGEWSFSTLRITLLYGSALILGAQIVRVLEASGGRELFSSLLGVVMVLLGISLLMRARPPKGRPEGPKEEADAGQADGP